MKVDGKKSKAWGHGSPNTVAQIIPHKNLGGFLSQDIIIGPNEMAVIVTDGKMAETLTQTKLRKIKGGFTNSVRRLMGKGSETEILFVDLSEKEVFVHFGEEYPVKPYTMDNDLVTGSLSILFRIDQNNTANLYSEVKNRPDLVLTTRDIRALLQREIANRVLLPVLKETPTDMIGKIDLIRKLEMMMRREVGKRMELFAIEPIQFTTSFEETDVQRVDLEIRKKEIAGRREVGDYEKQAIKYDKKAKVDDWAQDRDAERQKAKIHREVDLEREAGRVRDQKDTEVYQRRVRLEKEKLHDRIDMEETATSGHLKVDRMVTEAGLEKDIKTAKTRRDVGRLELEQDREEMDWLIGVKEKKDEFKMKRGEHETEMRVKEYQGTRLRSEEVVANRDVEISRSDAEKAKHSLETYEKALDRADKRADRDMAHIADIVGAAKQDLPHTYVQGASQTQPHIDVGKGAERRECGACGARVPSDSRFCPKCGERFED